MASLEGNNLVIFAYEIWPDKKVVTLVVVALEEGDYCTCVTLNSVRPYNCLLCHDKVRGRNKAQR
jgi:hypothetical protein